MRPQRQADVLVAGQPLTFRNVPVVGIGPESRLELAQAALHEPAFTAIYEVEKSQLRERSRSPSLDSTPQAALREQVRK